MPHSISKLERQARRLEERCRRLTSAGGAFDLSRYAERPSDYARDVLKVEWWHKQREIAELLLKPPYRVLVKASHSVGKSHLAGGLVNWWFDTHKPGICLTTAPTDRQVKKILWKEVRDQRRGRGGFIGPKAAELRGDSPKHYAHGFTARSGTGFQGQHERNVFLIFDEAVGVDAEFWDSARGMTMGVNYAWVCFCNPTDTTSRFYLEEQLGGWHVVHISALDHPNIAAELAGNEPPCPSAVRLEWVNDRLNEWSRPVTGEVKATDIEWPPGSGQYRRPDPRAQSRLLGRWPSISSGVWSDDLWASMAVVRPIPPGAKPVIGCDVARSGDDATAIHSRCGPVSLSHEEHHGFKANETVGRLKQRCRELAEWWNDTIRQTNADGIRPEDVVVNVDADGIGGAGVFDHRDGYSFREVSAASRARAPDDYPNKRSELWFNTAERAERGEMSVARLPAEQQQALKVQAMMQGYKMDAAGRRVCIPKEDLKKDLGQSPDGMDGFNLAYYDGGNGEGVTVVPTARPTRTEPKGPRRHHR